MVGVKFNNKSWATGVTGKRNDKRKQNSGVTREFRAKRRPRNFGEWVRVESQSDPNFFRWLFDDDQLPDFDLGDHGDEFETLCEDE